MFKIIFSLFLAMPALGQQSRVGTGNFAGLEDTDSPEIINPEEGQSVLNVESNILGTAIIKRKGYSQLASLTVATSPVTGAYQFVDTQGNLQTIVCQDINCAHSVNNGVFSVIYSTATKGVLRWSFVDVNGTVYAVDDKNDQPWSYNGTTFTQPFSPSVPLGSLIELSKDRLIISGTTSNPNRLYYSQSGTYTNFTTGVNSADPWTDDFGSSGDKITGLKYEGANLYIFKRQSILLCILADQYSTTCYPVASTIGTNTPASIVAAPDGIYFESQNGTYWKIPFYGVYGLQLLSQKISNFVKSQPQQFGNTGNNIQNNQASWQSGTQTPSNSWNTTSVVGSILDNTSLFTDSTTVNFSTGVFFANIDTATISNTIQLSSVTYADTWATTTAGVLNWTIRAGNFINQVPGITCNSSNGSIHDGGGNSIYTTSVAFSSGSWTVNHEYRFNTGPQCGGGDKCMEFRYLDDGTNYLAAFVQDNSGTTKNIGLLKSVGGTSTVLTQKSVNYGGSNTQHTLNVIRSVPSNVSTFYFDSVFVGSTTDNSVTSPIRTEIAGFATTDNSLIKQDFFNFNYFAYQSSGTFISRIFDTSFSTPTWGPFSSTFSVVNNNNQVQVDFYTRVSTSPNNDVWDSFLASSDTVKMTNAQKRYVQYKVNLNTFISTQTPTVNVVSLQAATTGQFVTQCIQPGTNITSWGTLNCDTSNNTGAANFVFYATSSVNCSGLTSNPPLNSAGSVQSGWQSQTNNASLTISTNAAVQIGFVDTIGSSTDTAQINSCLLNWNNGVLPQSVFSVFDPVKNALYWSTANNQLGTNNRLLKYDLNLAQMGYDPWFPMSINATALRFLNGSIYFGSSSSGTWNQYGNTNSDNGAAIDGYWQSKDFSCNAPFQDSQWFKTMVIARNQMAGNITQTFTHSLGATDTFNLSMNAASNLIYVRAVHGINIKSPAPFANLKFENSVVNQPFEINGMYMDCIANPIFSENP